MKKNKNDIPYGSYRTVLLHICCAPDATYPVFYLRGRHYKVTGFFYNPNIHPITEYEKRLSEIESFAKAVKMPLIKGNYDIKKWFDFIKGLEDEAEGGKRCYMCYMFRLERTAKLARELHFDYFTTTLSISPHKNSKWIFNISEEIENRYGVKFLQVDFKKRNGFKSSVVLSNYFNLYRQNYCGCVFSKIEAEKWRILHGKA
ncbi:MAG: recombinase [Nitrospiraceae bacterium]|nr:recombinase [Nitrospiraceae bacterium]